MVDEQFAHFVEMIQKIHVNVPLLDMIHVPTYARYIKDMINNKRPLSTTEVVKLLEECSATILNQPLEKKDPGCQRSHAGLEHTALRAHLVRPWG
jgi:hypothetical protein